MSKPVFILLHGAWHSPSCWSRLTPILSEHGYESVCPALPTSGSNPPLPDWSADVEVIRSTVSELVKEHDVVVATHSFSGMTGGTALEGLDKASCAAKGLKGGVIRLVYVMAFMVPEGFQHSKEGTRDNMVEEMKTDLEASIPTPHAHAHPSKTAPRSAPSFFLYESADLQTDRLARPAP